ncbi:RNA polymerase recycling motor HelD [Paenibacillus glycinis]|uniref:UvrD-helicase domain-containing protein n=1 Tax=Paenibacillus glycinis TaxID=2697035 RepID=A0ABW9XUV2_9BACL|nr:RNA polymerase recycling motor HelD [Paenibacillus glycinis]NBD26467.1 UvrD-helicase domain-containing protein [Paenibacillus glycinis]
MSKMEWKQEAERLDLIKTKLKQRLAGLDPQEAGLHEQVNEIRRRFWEEVTVNANTAEDFEETFYTIRQQEAVLVERERSHGLLMQQWKNMNRLLPSPYFGRIDFQETGTDLREQVYIGVSSFVDEDGMNFLVYDWRTPIASLYYDYSPGDVSFAAPGGDIAGAMTLKRQYQIRGGELQHVFDSNVTIGDELLQQVLGKGADTQMKSIVSTIQRDQNAIIRNDVARMVIVQGAAGSGKTSAAMQRIAYLLYKHRQTLKADQFVLFSPNPIFGSYVATVLPELGEENMQQTTFQEYLAYWLDSTFTLEDPFDQIEYVLTRESEPGYEARLSAIAYKASEDFLRALQNYATWLGREGMRFAAIRFEDRELISAERMHAQFYGYDSSIRLTNRVVLLQEWLLGELTALEDKERDAQWVQDEMNYLDREQYERAHEELLKNYRREEGIFDFAEQYVRALDTLNKKVRRAEEAFDIAEQEEELLRRMIVEERFKPIRRSIKRLKFVDARGLYAQLFANESSYREMTGEPQMPAHWPEICKRTRAKLDRQELDYEDATPFLLLKELVEGVRTNTEVRHLVIDEGQDYSVFQYAYLKKLFPRARMTVLGDFGQAIFTQATNLSDANSPLVRLYGEDETCSYRLVRSYRSTREIVEFTMALLPDGGEIIPFERNGRKPLIVRTTGEEERTRRIAADISALQSEGFGSIAVIAKTAAGSRGAYEALKARGCESLRLITKESVAFESGVMVIPAYLAKGVEFDAVLIYDASAQAYSREGERKLFYTACTRAMHRLCLYADADWTPFIRSMDPNLYLEEKFG